MWSVGCYLVCSDHKRLKKPSSFIILRLLKLQFVVRPEKMMSSHVENLLSPPNGVSKAIVSLPAKNGVFWGRFVLLKGTVILFSLWDPKKAIFPTKKVFQKLQYTFFRPKSVLKATISLFRPKNAVRFFPNMRNTLISMYAYKPVIPFQTWRCDCVATHLLY